MSEVDKILEELYRLELDRGLRMRASIEEDRGIISKSDIEKSYNKDVNVLREASWLISSSQARLSEAVKVLEPFEAFGKVVLSEAPASATHAHLFTDSEGIEHTISLEHFRAAKAFLATLGEKNEA